MKVHFTRKQECRKATPISWEYALAERRMMSVAGQREAAAFLNEVGLRGKVVQRVVARHGDKTKEEISKDPHYAMRNIKGINLG